MRDFGSGSGSSQSATTCIGKQIQHAQRLICANNLLCDPIPIHRLLRKDAKVPKWSRTQLKRETVVMNCPRAMRASRVFAIHPCSIVNAPGSLETAYAAQAQLQNLLREPRGAIVGRKIALDAYKNRGF